MAAIDDALTSARGAHYAVIATCIAAMLFASATDLAAPYRAARRDLKALRRIEWAKGRESLIAQAQKQFHDSIGKNWQNDPVYQAFLNRANGDQWVTRADGFYPLDEGWEPFLIFPAVTSPSSKVGQLIELGSTGSVSVRRPTVLRGAPLGQIAPDCMSIYSKHLCGIEVQRQSDSTYDVTVSQITFADEPKPIWQFLKTKKKLGVLHMEVRDSSIATLTMRGWIQSTYRGDSLFGFGEESSAFVPKLATVQREIAELTPTQAAAVLEEKIAGHEQQMSVFGFSVGGSFVTLVGPVILILTLTYLSFHINHLAELAPGNEKAISDFAWPLMFRGFPGIASAVLTLLIAPTTAVILLRIHGDDTNALSRSIPAVLLVLSAAASGVALRAELAAGNEKAISDLARPLKFRGFPVMTTAFVVLLILLATAVLLLRFHADNRDAFSRNIPGIVTSVLLFLSAAAGGLCLAARNRLVRTTGRARAKENKPAED